MSKEKIIEEIARDFNKGMCSDREVVESCAECVGASEHCLLYKIATRIYNAGYRKQSEWISVDERLPSEDERRDEYGELVPFLVCEKYTKYPYRAFYDGTIWGDGLMKIKGITHWMPLPEPPKMKGGAE